ncbi:MAG: DUF2970 domain-containing protein [Burkholderiaceae bacterium]
MSRRVGPEAPNRAVPDKAGSVSALQGRPNVNKQTAPAGPSSAWSTTKAIAWAFFGVRRSRDHDQARVRISPIHVIIAGFVGVFVLVAGLMVLVRWIAA